MILEWSGGELSRPRSGPPASRASHEPPAEPLQWTDYGSPAPDWATLPLDVRRRADELMARLTGAVVDVRWASFATRQVVVRSREDAVARRGRAWAVGPTGLTLLESRQAGAMGVDNKFRGSGEWSVSVWLRRPEEITVKRATLPAPPVLDLAAALGGDPTDSVRDPLGSSYGGQQGWAWTNLPLVVREAIEQAVPLRSAVTEEAEGRIGWGVGWVKETLWFERRSHDTLAAAQVTRQRHGVSGTPENASAAGELLRGLPWDVVAVRASLPDEREVEGRDRSVLGS